jgi:LPXTG-site transpeptidase (sortase) family protein
VIIDSLGIRAPVVPLEISGGTLYPPDDPTNVGWWRDGAMPGAVRGSAVVTGHTVANGDGVFDNLERLRTCDRVLMVTEKGVLRYVVRAEASYRRRALARRAPQLFSQSSVGRLVLVTCDDWNGEAYLSTHVVIATLA